MSISSKEPAVAADDRGGASGVSDHQQRQEVDTGSNEGGLEGEFRSPQ